MEPLSTTLNNIQKKNKDYQVEADPKRNMALSLQAPRGSQALAIPAHVTQNLVQDVKKTIEVRSSDVIPISLGERTRRDDYKELGCALFSLVLVSIYAHEFLTIDLKQLINFL